MSRTPLLLLVLAAACGSKSNGAVENGGGGTPGDPLSVELFTPSGEDSIPSTATLVAANGSQFPAVSADGATLVDLVADSQDFSGIPIATVVFWTKSGVAASVRLESAFPEEVPEDQTQKEQDALAQANAKLAETTWHPIEKVEATGEDPDTGAPNQLMVDGVTIELAAVYDKFPDPGDAAEGGGCGEVLGLNEGYGSKALGFAVVYPRITLGGDDCYGLPTADLAVVVPL